MIINKRWVLLTATAWLSLASCHALATDKIISFLSQEFEGRALVYRFSGKSFAIASPYSAAVAGSPSGQYQIGFNHSGYSDMSSPRTASLFVAIDVKQMSLTPDELKKLASENVVYLSDIRPDVREFTLDLELPSDKQEEARLRNEAGLPTKFRAGSLQIVNLTWSNVSGKLLYKWLTDPDGLKFVVKGSGSVSLRGHSSVVVNNPAIDAWWSANVGSTDDRLIWSEGAGILAAELAGTGALRAIVDEGPFAGSASLLEATKSLTSAIEIRSVPVKSGKRAIGLLDITNIAKVYEENVTVTSDVAIGSSAFPGKILSSRPEYVIDQSSGLSGLDVLLQDKR